ncbi:methylated-DNA--[protein]-cysteine S-methyltransferase [Actinomycetospora succinea]|uniref:methylated-DNA--[protein]-cysteine S-methyltransferase n=1 Tax=Actinomycetospora succinea TaxID=663603 RepID=UPI003C7C6549
MTALDDVGYGQTTTYRGLALLAGDNEPQGAQRAGIAMARNPILIRVPCHRVLAADGSLRGYRGGLDRKRALLDLESAARQTEAGAQPAAA